jgi:extracellular factor (EF) 3-hydroxypalmitic acid methyl ester biosynthesis protein
MAMESRPVISPTGEGESLVMFHNSQGGDARGTLLRLTRDEAVFEVYNPYSIVQASEVLDSFQVFMTDRLVYSGRAVVQGLVNTGLMLVCDVSLDEGWVDADIFLPINEHTRLLGEFNAFQSEWQRVQQILPAYKVVVADVGSFFLDLRRWLERIELGIRSCPNTDRGLLEREVIEQLRPEVLPAIDRLFLRFEEVANTVSEDLLPLHRTYVKRQLHPFVLSAPFAYRTYQKPLGYAGDYEMVNMILGDPFLGGSLFAKVLNVWLLAQPSAQAHRNRVTFLADQLESEVKRVAGKGRRARVLNLGCGPAGEVQRFLALSPVADLADLVLLDFNDETLDYVRRVLGEILELHHRQTRLSFEKRSVHQILKESGRAPDASVARGYDLIYCAGLFDYLSDRICKRLMTYFYELLAPEGLLIATNVDASNPNRNSMDLILEWHLIYRTLAQLKELAPEQADPDNCRVESDPTGVNIFIEVRKPRES